MLTLSQVIYGVQDLDVATRQIESRGFTVVDGGRHPGLGTANRIVPLGDAYFEILGIVDRQEALRNPFGSALIHQTQQGNRLVRWSLRADDIGEIARERGLTPENRSRLRPDGTLLTWKAAGLSLSLAEGWLPFFMQWDDPAHYLPHTETQSVFLQFASKDQTTKAEAQKYLDRFSAKDKKMEFYDAGHALNNAAMLDRDRWLQSHLRFKHLDEKALEGIPQLR